MNEIIAKTINKVITKILIITLVKIQLKSYLKY